MNRSQDTEKLHRRFDLREHLLLTREKRNIRPQRSCYSVQNIQVVQIICINLSLINHSTRPHNFTSYLDADLVREADPRGARQLVNNILALQEDIAKDAEPNTIVGLDTAEASRRASLDRGVVDVLSRDALLDAVEGEAEVGQGGRAREHVAAVGGAVGGAGHFSVVGLDDGGGEVQERGARVGDAVDGRLGLGAGADRVTREGELPPALAGVDVDVGDGARVL